MISDEKMKEENEIQKYLKKAKERIESAEILRDAGKYNDAISRIYYAFFDAATAALLNIGLTVKTHHGLVLLFEEKFIKTGKISLEIGKWLARAKETREEADYEIYKEFDKEAVESGIRAARTFIKEIEKFSF